MQTINCMDIVAEATHRLNQLNLLSDFQFIGGIGSAILRHPDTVLCPDERLAVASPDFTVNNPALDLIRENRTKRDIDGMVTRNDPVLVEEVDGVVKDVVKNRLRVEIFGVKDAERLRYQQQHPFGFTAVVKGFTAERYENPDGSLVKGVTPFEVPIPAATLEPWTARIGDITIPVPHPAMTVLNYATRSLSGLRPKDAEKVGDMAANIVEKLPGAREWVNDGPGSTHVELARVLHTLRWGRRHADPRILCVGGLFKVASGNPYDLAQNDAFVFKDADSDLQQRVLKLAIFKSRLLGRMESIEWVAAVWQRYIEPRIDSIVKND